MYWLKGMIENNSEHFADDTSRSITNYLRIGLHDFVFRARNYECFEEILPGTNKTQCNVSHATWTSYGATNQVTSWIFGEALIFSDLPDLSKLPDHEDYNFAEILNLVLSTLLPSSSCSTTAKSGKLAGIILLLRDHRISFHILDVFWVEQDWDVAFRERRFQTKAPEIFTQKTFLFLCINPVGRFCLVKLLTVELPQRANTSKSPKCLHGGTENLHLCRGVHWRPM